MSASEVEWKSYGEVVVPPFYDTGEVFLPVINVPVSTHDIPKPPKPEPKKIVNPKFEIDVSSDLVEFKVVIEPPIETDLDITTTTDAMPDEVADELPFTIVEEMPEPIGGELAFMKYLAKKIKYPSQTRRMGVEGKVFVEFVIDETGKIVDVHTVKGIGAGCDEEAERVLKNAPKWSPGKQRGMPVKVKKVLPIHFQLGDR